MQKLSHLAVNEEGFVFDPTTGDSYQVSSTGLHILGGLRSGMADEEIARSLAAKYEVGIEDARRDVADFRSNLKNLSLL